MGVQTVQDHKLALCFEGGVAWLVSDNTGVEGEGGD